MIATMNTVQANHDISSSINQMMANKMGRKKIIILFGWAQLPILCNSLINLSWIE